jgi:hypothetical protein
MHSLHLSTAKNLLSFVLTQCATVIIGGERSFNMRDMRDALSLVFVPFSTTSTFLPQFAPNPRASTRPGAPPLSEGCGPNHYMDTMAQDDNDKGRPSPYPKGCGGLISAGRRDWRGRSVRGDPGRGRPIWCVLENGPRHMSGSISPSSTQLTNVNDRARDFKRQQR